MFRWNGGILCSDFSPIVVKKMSSACAASVKGKVTFSVEDARKLSYSSKSIDVCIDKSLMDCMFYAKDRDLSLKAMMNEVHRVLNDGHGTALFMTQRDPCEVEPYFCLFERVEYIPIAALTNREGNVVPGCPACLYVLCRPPAYILYHYFDRMQTFHDREDSFDDYYDQSEFYELIFLYICVKGTKGPPKIVPYHDMKSFDFPPVEGAVKLSSKRSRVDDDHADAEEVLLRKKKKTENIDTVIGLGVDDRQVD